MTVEPKTRPTPLSHCPNCYAAIGHCVAAPTEPQSEPLENPPAFPRPMTRIQRIGGGITTDDGEPGMSLRDWFAGKALAGLLNNASVSVYIPMNTPDNYDPLPDATACAAYRYADAMLRERMKGQTNP